MAASNAVWGIDIGQCALKAIKLRPAENGMVEAVAFDVIEHAKILSQADADRDELISSALEKFASRNDWQGDRFVVGIPGQQTFARFCKMPPIDLKKDARKIPELVRYEASQQIPFDMDDVVWDYQVFTSDESPDIEVGIFAIRRELIRKHLGFFSAVGIAPTAVQAVPPALYNFARFDGQAESEDGSATVIVDVGAQNTDLIIVEPNSAWTRNIPLGGNSFTEALVRAFKLSFAKAESLKRSAATSKYARQIFQAMRPIFADLVAEIQRSLGFYGSTRRDVELKRVLALGNAFRLPGLQKYLENNLAMSGGVIKLDKFKKIVPTATTNAPQFTENVLSFGASYGLALQGLELAQIHANLLPPELARVAVWRKKRPYFVATAASLMAAAAVPWVSNRLDAQTLDSQRNESMQNQAQQVIREARNYQQQYNQARQETTQEEQDIENLLKLQEQRAVVPRLFTLVHDALPPINPPELAAADSARELQEMIRTNPERYPRTERGQLIIESLEVEYAPDIEEVTLGPERKPGPGGGGPTAPMPGAPGGMPRPGGFGGYPGAGRMGGAGGGAQQQGPGATAPGFVVHIKGRLLFGTRKSAATQWLEGEYYNNLRQQSRQQGMGFYIPADDPQNALNRSISQPQIVPYHRGATNVGAGWTAQRPAAAEEGEQVAFPDPVTGEDTRHDWSVEFTFKVKMGEMPQAEEAPDQGQNP